MAIHETTSIDQPLTMAYDSSCESRSRRSDALENNTDMKFACPSWQPKTPQANITTFIKNKSKFSSSHIKTTATWYFQNEIPIHYEIFAPIKQHQQQQYEPLFILNGFACGSDHQYRLVTKLLEQKQNAHRTIYCMDFASHGQSWSQNKNEQEPKGFGYSGTLWVQQTIDFIQHVILLNNNDTNNQHGNYHYNTKVHLAGNSAGGHVAVCVAAARPDLIQSVTLFNAIICWGLNLPFWSGIYPIPQICDWISYILLPLFQSLIFFVVYFLYGPLSRNHDAPAVTKYLIQNSTGKHAALASVLWSPPVSIQLPKNNNGNNNFANFVSCVKAIQCPVLMVWGQTDPLCPPSFAKFILEHLNKSTKKYSSYVELSNVGHCPNHEAPVATSNILTRWMTVMDCNEHEHEQQQQPSMYYEEHWGTTIAQERDESEIKVSPFQNYVLQYFY